MLDDWMRLVGEHRGIINMVSSAGDRTSVSAGSPGDSQETKVELSAVNRLSADDGGIHGALGFLTFALPKSLVTSFLVFTETVRVQFS